MANGKVLLAYGALPLPQPRHAGALHAADDHHPRRAGQRNWTGSASDGYATAVAELEEGLVAVAAPVFDPAGPRRTCVAALSVSGPGFRMLPETLDGLGKLCASA